MMTFLFLLYSFSYLLQARELENTFIFSNLQRGYPLKFTSSYIKNLKSQQIKTVSKSWHQQINSEEPNKKMDSQRFLQISTSQCGNYIIETFEDCDDGNKDSGDGCSIQCKYQCGDGNLNSLLQQCDDGNRVSGDGCSSTCKIENPGSRNELAVGVCIVATFLVAALIAIQSFSKNKPHKSQKSEKELQRINQVQIKCETKIKIQNINNVTMRTQLQPNSQTRLTSQKIRQNKLSTLPNAE